MGDLGFRSFSAVGSWKPTVIPSQENALIAMLLAFPRKALSWVTLVRKAKLLQAKESRQGGQSSASHWQDTQLEEGDTELWLFYYFCTKHNDCLRWIIKSVLEEMSHLSAWNNFALNINFMEILSWGRHLGSYGMGFMHTTLLSAPNQLGILSIFGSFM